MSINHIATHQIGGNRKTLLTIDEHGSKIARNSVFDCQLSPNWRQMAIENSVSDHFYLSSSIVLTFSIAAYSVFASDRKVHSIDDSFPDNSELN